MPEPTATPVSELQRRCKETPGGMACLWIHNYLDGSDTLRFNFNRQEYDVPPGGDLVVYLQPGGYVYSVAIVGPGQSTSTGTFGELKANRYYFYSVR
jgi:hypothetical protein